MSDRRGRPIGIFDSGLGGLTVARAVIDVLPNESIVYYGDTARFPYGTKPAEDVHRFSLEIINMLLEQDVKMIVVGCNSASSALWRLGRPQVDVPIVGVIDPPAKSAVRLTRNRRVGIIGTDTTIRSKQYDEAVQRWAERPVLCFAEPCPEFVELAERGETVGARVLDVAQRYLEPLKRADVDTLVLGCTHYPPLSGTIQYVMGPDVLLVSSAQETAKDVYTVLVATDLLRTDATPPVHTFVTSGDEDEFLRLGHRFLGPELSAVKRHPLGE